MLGDRRAIDIIIPFYRNPNIAGALLRSAESVADELRETDCCFIAINDSPDDGALRRLLAQAPERLPGIPFQLIENEENLGFVGSANAGLRKALERGHDALLLNSDTQLFPGAVREMRRVAGLDPMIGFVSPRSNNATICSLPQQEEFQKNSPEEAWAAFRVLSRHLPEFHFVPTAVGFCLLIRVEMLDEFGLLDESYGRGYNEENDLVMRANRCGYSAVLANRAFVYHRGESSFSGKTRWFSTGTPEKPELEERNATLLAERYPEYVPHVSRYYENPHYEAERMLSGMLPDARGRRSVLFDFSSAGPYYNGTVGAAKEILRRAAAAWRGKFVTHVMVSESAARFHRLHDIPGLVVVPLDTPKIFSLAFRFGQPFDFQQVMRLSRLGVVNVYGMLDPISYDCLYLNDLDLDRLWGSVFETADGIVYISDFVAQEFHHRFNIRPGMRELVSYLSLNLRDYAPPPSHVNGSGDYILVMGNAFSHKHVRPTVRALREAFPDLGIVAVGMPRDAVSGVTAYPSGWLPESRLGELMRGARALVFPSHYEGFGLPVLEGLSYRKPVLARSIPVMSAIRDKLRARKNLILYSSTSDLVHRLAQGLPEWQHDEEMSEENHAAGWDASVRELGQWFEELVESVSLEKTLLPRLRHMRLLALYAGIPYNKVSMPRVGAQVTPQQTKYAMQNVSRLSLLLKDRETEIAQLRSSASWKLTAPLRAIFEQLLRFRR